MYNIDFLPQLEKSRRAIFGAGCIDSRACSDRAHKEYALPANLKVVECYEDTNGEWVPKPEKPGLSKLEKKIS